MERLTKLAAVLLLVTIASVVSSRSLEAQNQSAGQVTTPSILPEAPGTVNGGNPFQGLGRPDDTGPQRVNPIQQYVPGNNSTGLFSTGNTPSSTSAGEQPGFGGQAGYSSAGQTVGSGQANTGPNASPLQNPNPLPQPTPGNEATGDTTGDAEAEFSASKILTSPHPGQSEKTSARNTREANQLAMALKEMNGGNYTKCLETLDSITKTEPKNAQAYYVKAVTNVLMRDFAHARQNYELTLRYTSDEQLIAKTKAGLLKLGR